MTGTSNLLAELNLKPGTGAQRLSLWRRPFFLIAVIILASLTVRLAALLFWGTGAIESEGTEYARIAQNLRNGTGYVGITSPGYEIVFPPFYPLLICVGSFFTHDYEWAGRLVALILGALLPLPVFAITSRLFGRQSGFVAALLAIFYPVLVNLSFVVLSEGPYLTILLSAVYIVLRALDRPSTGVCCLVGGFFGLAYLTRQEAVAPFLIALFLLVCFTEGSLPQRAKRVFAAIAVFVVLALPEVIYLYKATGQIRLEAKSSLFYADQVRQAIARENNEADPGEWAGHSINATLERTGTRNRPEADVVRETRITFRQVAHNLKMGVRKNVPALFEALSSRWLGAPFLTALALLGAVRRPWTRPLASSHLYIMLVPLTAILATFSSDFSTPRYYFVLIPFFLIWAGNGLVGIALWTKTSLVAAGWRSISPAIAEWLVPGVIGFVLILYPIDGVRSLWQFQQGSRATLSVKQLGKWIGQQQDRQVMIMDRSTPLAFHANAQWIDFPYCDGELALRFLDTAKVDYVVFHQNEKYTPYYQDWFTNGIPDRRAELVYGSPGPHGTEIMVYRWNRGRSQIP